MPSAGARLARAASGEVGGEDASRARSARALRRRTAAMSKCFHVVVRLRCLLSLLRVCLLLPECSEMLAMWGIFV